MADFIGITLGDITGIGPEVALKAVAAELPRDGARYLLIGDAREANRINQRFELGLAIEALGATSNPARVLVTNPLAEQLPGNLPSGSPVAARAAVAWLADGAQRCLRHELSALVTAPVNKEAIVRSGQAFVGQTEFLTQLSGVTRTAMMLLGRDQQERWLRVVLVTTHVSLKQVASRITSQNVMLAIELAATACRNLGLPRARIAVCGLNPHAGEGGQMGDEEQTIIGPAVISAQAQNYDVVGPLSGDTVFHHALHGEYDAVVAMYHDQGLAPLKAVAFATGVNWTLGLPFIRTSPDHGTAYDLAGQGVADPSSMISAIRLAKQLARTRD